MQSFLQGALLGVLPHQEGSTQNEDHIWSAGPQGGRAAWISLSAAGEKKASTQWEGVCVE